MPSAPGGEPGPSKVRLERSSLRTLPAQPLDRDDDRYNEHHEHDGQGRRQAHGSLGECQYVDLDPWDRGCVARTACCSDVNDVKSRQCGDHGDGQAYAYLIFEKWDGDRDELPDPACAVEPGRLIEGRVYFAH